MGSFIGDMLGTWQKMDSLNYQGNVARTLGTLNKQNYDTAAASAVDAGNAASAKTRLKGDQVVGAESAALGASGVDASSKSGMDAMMDTRLMSELDAQTQKNNAAREAWGYKVKGVQAEQQGIIDQAKAQDEEKGSILTGFGKGVSDLTSFGSKFGS